MINPLADDGLLPPTMLGMDGAAHEALRRLCRPYLRAERVKLLAPALRRIAQDLLGSAQGPEIELVSEVIRPYNARSIAAALGAPSEVLLECLAEVPVLARSLEPELTLKDEARLDEASKRVSRAMADLLEHADPSSESLLGALVRAISNNELDFRDAVSTMYLMYGAGVETSSQLIAGALVEPELAGVNDADELATRVCPVQFVERAAALPFDIESQHIEQDERIFVSLAAASLDPGRPHGASIAFGRGAHLCLGAPLARVSVPILLEHVRSEKLTITRWRRNRQTVIRGLHSVSATRSSGG